MQTCKLIPDVGDLPFNGFNTNNMIHPGKSTKSTGRDLGCDKDKTHIALLNKTVVMRAELILSTQRFLFSSNLISCER